MDDFRGGRRPAGSAGWLTQLYLKDNLVVAVQESHHRAHVEESGEDEERHRDGGR